MALLANCTTYLYSYLPNYLLIGTSVAKMGLIYITGDNQVHVVLICG